MRRDDEDKDKNFSNKKNKQTMQKQTFPSPKDIHVVCQTHS